MKVKDALYQIGQLEKLEDNLGKVASVLFNNESLSNEVAEKAELSEEKPFFVVSRARGVVAGEIERIRNAMNEVEFDA